MKRYWRVVPRPTGIYASFEHRDWPYCWTGFGKNEGHLLAQIIELNGLPYSPADRTREDLCLAVRIFNYSKSVQQRTTHVTKPGVSFRSIAAAKAFVDAHFAKNPSWYPKERK